MDTKNIVALTVVGAVSVAGINEASHIAHGIKAKTHIEVEAHQPIDLGRSHTVTTATGSVIDSSVKVYEIGGGVFIVSSGYPTVKFRG